MEFCRSIFEMCGCGEVRSREIHGADGITSDVFWSNELFFVLNVAFKNRIL